MIGAIVILACRLALAAPATQPETFELSDGRMIAGTTIAFRESKLIVKTPSGEQAIAIDALARMTRLPAGPKAKNAGGLGRLAPQIHPH